MRKLKLQVQTTIDGFIAGPNGEMDWLTHNWTDDIKKFVIELTNPVDLILLGKNLAMGFIPHWTAALKAEQPEEGARIFVETPKIVFSATLNSNDPMTAEWEHTSFENGNYVDAIQQLKNQPGGDIIVYGGGKFVASLLKANLIDELNLFVNPVIIGKGMSIFKEVQTTTAFELAKASTFDCGIIALTYHKK